VLLVLLLLIKIFLDLNNKILCSGFLSIIAKVLSKMFVKKFTVIVGEMTRESTISSIHKMKCRTKCGFYVVGLYTLAKGQI